MLEIVLKILTEKGCLILGSSLSHSDKQLGLNLCILTQICPDAAHLRRLKFGFQMLRNRMSCVFRNQPIYNLIELNKSSTSAAEVEQFSAKLLINF